MFASIGLVAAAAELTPAPDPGEHRVSAEVSAEPHLVVAAGYERGVAWAGHAVGVSAAVAVPVFLLDGAHQRWRLGARTAAVRWRALGVDVLLSGSAQTTASDLFRGVSLGVGGAVRPGVYGERGYAAVELGVGLTPATWITPTDTYARDVWDAPRGWYAGTGTSASAAVCGGVTVGRVGLGAQLGFDGTLAGGHRTAPVFAGLGSHVDL